MWGWPALEHFASDLRYAARTLWRAPGFTLVAIVTLALGLGMNTAVFSVVNAVMIRRLPYREPGRLMALWEEQDFGRTVVAPANLVEYQRRRQRDLHRGRGPAGCGFSGGVADSCAARGQSRSHGGVTV